MTTAQVFIESLKTTVFGMGLVLTTLYILSLILDLMRVIFAPQVKKNKTKKHPLETAHIETETDQTDKDQITDTKLIAVITAAIAEYMGDGTAAIKVNTIRQIHTKTPVWGMTSRINQGRDRL